MYETSYSFEDDSMRLVMPIAKVDEERRTVHGFATLDNLDKQDDIVPLEASIKAFEMFRGNIREQHDSRKAVGRMVSFRPETIYDPTTGDSLNGVFVSAYVSRGAQDTWEKVLDGTLSGFSIGAHINEARTLYDNKLDKSIRYIDDYELIELSLVDTPANPLANVTLVQKVGGVVEALDIKGELETIFMCDDDMVIQISKENVLDCPVCKVTMKDVGFVESNDTEKAGIIKNMVTKHIETHNNVKEANVMAEQNETETVEKADEVVEETPEAVETVEAVEEPVVESVEKADEEAEAEAEAPVEEVVVEKADEPTVNELLVKSLQAVTETLTSLTDRIAGIEKSISEKMSDVESKVTEAKDSVEKFGKRVDKVEDATAFRKSGDLGEVAQEEVVEKASSVWGGKFLTSIADL